MQQVSNILSNLPYSEERKFATHSIQNVDTLRAQRLTSPEGSASSHQHIEVEGLLWRSRSAQDGVRECAQHGGLVKDIFLIFILQNVSWIRRMYTQGQALHQQMHTSCEGVKCMTDAIQPAPMRWAQQHRVGISDMTQEVQ